MAEQQQTTTIGEQDFIGTESGFWETAWTSFKSNPIPSVVMSQSLREKFWQSNAAPVTDEDIGARVKSEGLDPYLEHFAYVKNVGELDAKVNDIRRQVEHNRTLQMASGGLGTVATMLGAIADPLNFVLPAAPGFVAGKTIASTTARGVAAFGAGGALTAGVGEGIKVMVNDLDDARSAGVTIGGATIFGGVVGLGVGQFVGRKVAAKVGEGVKAELAGINNGSIPDVKEKLDELVSLQARPRYDRAVTQKHLDNVRNTDPAQFGSDFGFEGSGGPLAKTYQTYLEQNSAPQDLGNGLTLKRHTWERDGQADGYTVFDAKGNRIAAMDVTEKDGQFYADGVFVDAAHQRKGLATKLYDTFEADLSASGVGADKWRPSDSLKPDGKAFLINRLERRLAEPNSNVNARESAGATVSADEIRNLRSRAETNYTMSGTAESVMDPQGYGKYVDAMQTVPEDVQAKFQLHGTGNGEKALFDLIENGIDPAREFHSGPPLGGTHGVDSTRWNRPYIFVSDADKSLRDTGIKNVIVNGPAAESTIGLLRERFPHVNFMTPEEAAAWMQGKSISRAVIPEGQHPTPSGLSFEPTVPDYGKIAASGADLKSLKSAGAEWVANKIYNVFGGSIPMEMLNATAATPRMVAAKMGLIRVGFQDGVVAPTSVAGVAARMYGQRDIAREGVILAWHDWAKEGSYVFSPLERNTNAALGLEKFTDLVARAVAYGDNVSSLADANMRTALSHPAVQKAAKAYRKFDDWVAKESIRSGLLRQQHVTDNHLRHDYNVSNVAARRDEFVKVESDRAFTHEMDKQTAEATRAHAEKLKQIDDEFTKKTDDFLAEVQANRAKEEGKSLDEIVKAFEDKFNKALNVDASQRLGRRYFLLVDRAERQAVRQEAAERRKLTRAITRETDPLTREQLQADLDGLHTRIQNELEGKLNALEREHEANWKAIEEKLASARDEKADRAVNLMQSKLATRFDRIGKRESEKLLKLYNMEVKKANARLARETGENERVKMRKWADDHADGVAYTITTGDSGVGGSHGRLTGGNIRGGNQARNVYTSTTELLERGFLNTDLLRIMEKQARQEGIDAVIARSFRRNLTDAERRLAARNHGDAYWLDGSDPTTIPDLELRQPTADMRDEYLKLANATTNPQEKVRLTEEHRKQLQNIEEALGIMRGQFSRDIGVGELAHVSRFLKSFNYAVYMGKSLLTNTQDLAKFQMTYGTYHVMQYGVARLKERFTSLLEGNGLLNDAGRQELIESAKAMSFGLEGYNYQRLGALAGIGDPYSASSVNSKLDATGQLMAAMGSKVFGMNYFTNLEKRWAAGLTMHRIGKLAMREGKLADADAAWLRQIGVDSKTLREIRNAHMEQIGEGGYKPGQVLRLNPDDLHPDLADKYAAAVYKDVTQVVVTPHELNKPRIMHNPLASAMFQFSTFALESSMSTTTQLGQRLRSGEVWLPITGVGAVVMGAVAIDLLKTVADDDDGKKTAAWFRAWDRNPGFMAYTMADKSGVAGALTWASNLSDELTGVGLRSAARSLAGDNVKDQYPLSVKRQGQNNQHAVQAWNTLGGATARTINNGAEIAQDVIGSLAGSKHGAVPLLLSNRRINQTTLKKAADMTPLAGAFWLRAGIAQGGLMPDIKAWSQTFPKR